MASTDIDEMCIAFNSEWHCRSDRTSEPAPLTVGDLKKMLEPLDDDVVIVRWADNDFIASYGQYHDYQWGFMAPLWEVTDEMRELASSGPNKLGDYADDEQLAEFQEEHPDSGCKPAARVAVVL